MLNLLLLVIVLGAIPVNSRRYDVFVPLRNIFHRRGLEVFLLQQSNNLRSGSSRLDMVEVVKPTESPDVDNFESSQLDGRDDLRGAYGLYSSLEDYKTVLRIIGGSDAAIRAFPYHVAYGKNCAGAIISPKWILTAAHCHPKTYIRSGSNERDKGKHSKILNSYIHPEWNATRKMHPFDYDFQLVELAEQLRFDENTQPIKVARMTDMIPGKELTVTGFGATEELGLNSKTLQAVIVPIVLKENCQQVAFPFFRGLLTPRMFCAGYKEGNKDACQGDSGGPAVANDRLVGMVSFGYGCATPNSYGVYSKVATVRDWIKNVTGLELD